MPKDITKFGRDIKTLPDLFDIIIPGAACNMKCKYCFGEHCISIRNKCDTILNEEKLDEALKNVNKNQVGFVTIWGGEPLYNEKQLIDTVSYVRKNYPRAIINMLINGSLLNDKWTQFIIDNRLSIGISHDGPGQKYRGVDFLENPEISKNIVELRKLDLFRSFNCVYHKLNCSTPDIINYFMQKEDELKIELGCNPRLIHYVNEASSPFIFKPEDYPAMDRDIEWVVSMYMKSLLNDDPTFFRKYLSIFKDIISDAISVLTADAIEKEKFYIKDVPSCGCLSYPHVTITGDLVFCNSVVESEEMDRAKDMLKNFKSYPKCATCEVKAMCRGLCSAFRYEQIEKNCDMYIHYYNTYLNTVKTYL